MLRHVYSVVFYLVWIFEDFWERLGGTQWCLLPVASHQVPLGGGYTIPIRSKKNSREKSFNAQVRSNTRSETASFLSKRGTCNFLLRFLLSNSWCELWLSHRCTKEELQHAANSLVFEVEAEYLFPHLLMGPPSLPVGSSSVWSVQSPSPHTTPIFSFPSRLKTAGWPPRTTPCLWPMQREVDCVHTITRGTSSPRGQVNNPKTHTHTYGFLLRLSYQLWA